MKHISLFVFVFFIFFRASADPVSEAQQRPVNIILMIGDGMGLSALSTMFYFGDLYSEFSRFDQIGLMLTSSASNKITDSAASATAMATGVSTYNGAVGMDSTGRAIPNFIEIVSRRGWSTGIVATSSITHATPACFYAHVSQRSMESGIATQLLVSEVDFFAGGGLDFFTNRSDKINLLKIAEQNGFVINTRELAEPGSLVRGQKYGFLLADVGMPRLPGKRGDYLPEATSLAIAQLSKNEGGFFLMVEGSQIDWAGHENDADYMIAEIQDFEKAVAIALDYAEEEGNTLVIVTADHETGGAALTYYRDERTGRVDQDRIGITYASPEHTATLIPVFAYGPEADLFRGIYRNTEIFHKMVEAESQPR